MQQRTSTSGGGGRGVDWCRSANPRCRGQWRSKQRPPLPAAPPAGAGPTITNSHDSSADHPAEQRDEQSSDAPALDPVWRRSLHALRVAAQQTPADSLADRLCAAATRVLGIDGASVAARYTPSMSVPVGASDVMAAAAEQAQFTAGEGPCMDAHDSQALTLVTDLGNPADAGRRRWPTYAVLLARATDYRWVVAVPVPPPARPWPRAAEPSAALGLPLALTCYGRRPLVTATGSVAEAATALGTAMSGVLSISAALSVVLSETSAAGPGPAHAWLDSRTAQLRAAVWQAEEVLLLAEAGLDRAGALAALRTYAVIHAISIDEVARRLLGGGIDAEDVRGRR